MMWVATVILAVMGSFAMMISGMLIEASIEAKKAGNPTEGKDQAAWSIMSVAVVLTVIAIFIRP